MFTVADPHAVIQIKKIPKIFNFTDPKSFKSTEISGVGWDVENKQLFKDDPNLNKTNT